MVEDRSSVGFCFVVVLIRETEDDSLDPLHPPFSFPVPDTPGYTVHRPWCADTLTPKRDSCHPSDQEAKKVVNKKGQGVRDPGPDGVGPSAPSPIPQPGPRSPFSTTVVAGTGSGPT